MRTVRWQWDAGDNFTREEAAIAAFFRLRGVNPSDCVLDVVDEHGVTQIELQELCESDPVFTWKMALRDFMARVYFLVSILSTGTPIGSGPFYSATELNETARLHMIGHIPRAVQCYALVVSPLRFDVHEMPDMSGGRL